MCREIYEYPDGASCGGDEVGLLFSGNDDQTFECEGGGRYYSHDFSLKGFEAAGKKLLLYPDLGCLEGVVGEAETDGCHITPTAVSPIAAWQVDLEF
jgi:hypothetical protein